MFALAMEWKVRKEQKGKEVVRERERETEEEKGKLRKEGSKLKRGEENGGAKEESRER